MRITWMPNEYNGDGIEKKTARSMKKFKTEWVDMGIEWKSGKALATRLFECTILGIKKEDIKIWASDLQSTVALQWLHKH